MLVIQLAYHIFIYFDVQNINSLLLFLLQMNYLLEDPRQSENFANCRYSGVQNQFK